MREQGIPVVEQSSMRCATTMPPLFPFIQMPFASSRRALIARRGVVKARRPPGVRGADQAPTEARHTLSRGLRAVGRDRSDLAAGRDSCRDSRSRDATKSHPTAP